MTIQQHASLTSYAFRALLVATTLWALGIGLVGAADESDGKHDNSPREGVSSSPLQSHPHILDYKHAVPKPMPSLDCNPSATFQGDRILGRSCRPSSESKKR